jgi:hypothetical protein
LRLACIAWSSGVNAGTSYWLIDILFGPFFVFSNYNHSSTY